ncbi:zinc finger protein 687-like isoform X2 [Ornithodoros turicata]|uniref:zinc finger protein 687-like isoform X2 n=1 Tax=Ornithodoros turicata TaxID=34597 RepID=UPI003138725D
MSVKPRNNPDVPPVTLDDFLREWSTDPLPKYANPNCSGQRSHECRVCGDRYLYPSSLRRHLARKTFLARLPCRTCRICHLAFNRCALILRAQRCKLKATAATLTSLPQDEPLVPLDVGDDDDITEKAQDVPMTTLEKVLQNAACSECSIELADSAAREDHFHASRGNLLKCGECTMVCTSECALKAHRRLHTQGRPFVCPECGTRTNKPWAVFERHVTQHCHHYERIVGYHCQLCPALLLDQGELASHIVDTHSNPLHKCQACPMAFVTLDSFHNHRRTTHPKLRSQCWIILKCPLCEAVFASSDLLTSHVGGHLDRCGRSLFRCTACDSLQPTRSDLVAHVGKCHPGLHETSTLLEEADSPAALTANFIVLLDDDCKPGGDDKDKIKETPADRKPAQRQKVSQDDMPLSALAKRRKSSTDVEDSYC